MPDLPDPNLKPEDTDRFIRDYGRKLELGRKESLMDKLRRENERMKSRNTPPPSERKQGRDR